MFVPAKLIPSNRWLDHDLAPAFDDRLVDLVEGLLTLLLPHHRSDRLARTTPAALTPAPATYAEGLDN